ncbi:hypothetical protein QBC39DRAFT_355599 [Podospora conica]|nr:hypothetical protein QBC39DRAFT_355599 [Schizothecium conicum]
MAESDSAICSASGSGRGRGGGGGGASANASTLAASATRPGPGAANRDAAFDASGLPWDLLLPWLLFDARATALGPHESLEPLTPRASPEFDLALLTTRHLSWELPFFLNTNTTATAASTRTSIATGDVVPQQTPRVSHDDAHTHAHAHAHDRHPSHTTFFISPSASTSSLLSSASSWASDPSRDSDSADTLSTMPGPLLELPPLTPFDTSIDTDDYLRRPSTCAAPEMAIDSTPPWRPQSTHHGASGSPRPSSPLFARWAKRHHHQGHHRHHGHGGPLQPAGPGTGPGSGAGTGPGSGSGRGSTESKASHSSSMSAIVKRSPARSRPGSMHKRQSHIGSVPQMTRDEFEALPLAIQRKYFSTLERLRFARESTHVEGISQHYNDISHYKRRKPRQNRSVSEHIASRITRRSSLLESRFTTPDSSVSCVGLPDRVYSREEQVALARHLRASVILDAADEAICKLNRRASKKRILDAQQRTPPALTPGRDSMESLRGPGSPVVDRPSTKDVPQSFYETFRWMDEEEDLDLRLFLDDYHANLRDDLPTPTNQQRPSFRRHLSISKIPFSRNSVSLSRPATKDATTPASPLHSPTGSASQPGGYTKRKSRALSLITPRHAPQSSISSIDPAAAHYQDPEARLKLRVYLASPQKFDEAIEFGFPSADVLSGGPVGKGGGVYHQRQPSSNMRSFLADDDEDDNVSLNSDQPSLADPDSPKTPQATEPKYGPVRPLRAPSTEPTFPRDGKHTPEPGNYAQAPASSREMTLRMTLTRPDLRAHEEQIYGWQQKAGGHAPQQHQAGGRKSTTLAPMMAMESSSVTYIGDGKESLERVGPANYDWGSTTADKGVMKRIWNRVRRA